MPGRREKSLLALCLVAATLAGCVGAEDDVDPADEESVPQDADEAVVTESTGSVVGKVSSDLFEPLGGARVTLVESGQESVVSRTGAYTINEVEPGAYTAFVTAVGYNSLTRAIQVAAGDVTDATFQLTPLPSDEPWVDSKDYAGHIGYAYAYQVEPPGVGCQIIETDVRDVKTCSGSRSASSINGEVNPNVTADVRTILVEMVWQPAGPLGEYLKIDLMCPEVPRGTGGAVLDTEHVCYWDTPGGESPLIHRVDEEHWLQHGYNFTGDWAARVFANYGMLGTHGLTGIDAGVAYEQAFMIYVNVFHKEPAPADFSGIPDA